jgi:ParB family transcriptional regulator, chromosome partitioning protein
MDFKSGLVPLDRIDTSDCAFKITSRTDPSDLAGSIDVIGLLQPPMLIEKGPAYSVVCGFRRIAACMSLNREAIPARILEADTPAMICARIAIADNAFQRPLDVVEQSRAIALIRRFARESSAWPSIAAKAGLSASRAALNRILPVADMSPDLQNAILEGSIALATALQIHRLKKEDRTALCRLLRSLNASLNIQRELMTLIGDIAFRDGVPMAALIAREEIESILQNEDTERPQKVRVLRRLLKAKRYPALSKAESAFHQMVKSLKLSPRIQLQPPPYFEGKTYRLSLSIDSRPQLLALIGELEKIARHPGLLPEEG